MVSEAKLDKLPTIQRWELHKQIIQDAARIARNDELEKFPDKFDSRFLMFRHPSSSESDCSLLTVQRQAE